MNEHREQRRSGILRRVISVAIAILIAKVLWSVLYEYRWYFPANFEAAFLSGRRATFVGLYRAAFYAHILVGPVAVLLSSFLFFSGGRSGYRQAHRVIGRTLGMLVMLVVVPSGFVMALQTHGGPVAMYGFIGLSILTAACMMMAANQARVRNFRAHRLWAHRTFIMLCSPLLLRLMAGATIVLQIESESTYRFIAWSSWLIPMTAYEVYRLLASDLSLPVDSATPLPVQPHIAEGILL